MKIAVVTGSCVRTGRAIAERLARDGRTLVIHGKPSAQAEAEAAAEACRAAGGQAVVALADLSTAEGCRALAAAVPEGRLELVVHNVGIYRKGALADYPSADWEATLATNLSAPFHLTQALLPRLERGSSLIALGYAGIEKVPATRATGAYTVSKVGLLALVRAWALELAARGVRANMVSPGQLENSVDLPIDWSRRIPLGRPGRVEEIAEAVAWLSSEAASYITGQNLEVAGGLLMALRGEA